MPVNFASDYLGKADAQRRKRLLANSSNPAGTLAKQTKYNLRTTPGIQAQMKVNRPASSSEAAKLTAKQAAYRDKSNEILGSDIVNDGSRANQYVQQAIEKRNQKLAASQPSAQWSGFEGGLGNFSGGTQADVDRYLAALRQVESSGNYNARSKISSASGAYQYIDSTWGGYGGYQRAYQAPKHIQDQRARQDALNQFNRYGNWEQVAAHHFYPAWAGDKSKWNNAPGRGNPSVNTYVRKVMGNMGRPGGAPLPVGGDVSGIRKQIVNTALGYQGIPYVWGGKTPRGFDCSGLTSYVYRQFGINLPAWSNHQTQVGVRSHINNARPGDLVGWNKGGHVAIYIGNGKIMHSPRPGTVAQVRSLYPGEGVYAVRLSLPGD